MKRFEVEQFSCLEDNFGVLVHDPSSKLTAAIDAPEEQPIVDVLTQNGWQLSHIFITHHHVDHIAALPALKAQFSAQVIGPKSSSKKIHGIDIVVGENDKIEWADCQIQILKTPGHTLDHISYWFKDENLAFVGDTLFSLGCGRLFEGDAQMMYTSLQKLANLPDHTHVYCGHEYTLSNARFAKQIDPTNPALQARVQDVEHLRQTGQPTLPTTIGLEKKTNPFLRAHDIQLQKSLGLEGKSAQEVFAHIRKLKDHA